MSYLVSRKTELQFRTASTVIASGKERVIVVESRPNYAVVKLAGGKEQYPISWEQIFKLAEKRHARNLQLERQAAKQVAREPDASPRPPNRKKHGGGKKGQGSR
jgi:hypothetical protein